MSNPFFEQPILNSPYVYPSRHWELDASGQPTQRIIDKRRSTLLFNLTQRLLYTKWRDPGEAPKLYLFGQLKRITKQWLDACLVCEGETLHLGNPDIPAGLHRAGG